ncbi:NACHT domain-containing protein [Lentzea aerocolonigenes]|uniref:NACHT domain-containing protein n=1 Tax=Lentzea aerocolonigenes TaxID=68170 RepID=UPI0006963CA5|nr:NACHT domain-containing protein [Lentzea aerocolonigenes]
MADPALMALVERSAAGAVGGLAVRASAIGWKESLSTVLPAPDAVRRHPAWADLELARAHQDAIAQHLSGRLCAGLLELLAFLELSDGDHAEEQDRLAATFVEELAGRLELPDEQTAAIGTALWDALRDTVRLAVVELRQAGAFDQNDLVHATRVVQAPDPANPSLAQVVVDRAEISADFRRVTAAHAAVRSIKQEMRRRFARLVMPHSREDYRVPIEDIYVNRVLAPWSGTGSLGPVISEDDLAERRFVVIGNPGAGKSTFIRRMMYQFGSDESRLAPLVLELKDHQRLDESYVTLLAERLGVLTQHDYDAGVVRDVLALGLAVIVFDGIDEISDVDRRRATVEAIEAFCLRYPLVRVVVTAREEGYTSARLDPAVFPVFYLPDFTDPQVETYVGRWFRLTSGPRHADPARRVEMFLLDSLHVGDLRTNPLMLSLLCMIYEYDGYIPENRPQVYEQCAELLFERWDRVRQLPGAFRPKNEHRYLVQELAFYLFNRVDSQSSETEAKLRDLIGDYLARNVLGGRGRAATTAAQEFLDYCGGRAWLLCRTGDNARGEKLYGFTHRTFMEYFAACFMVRHCNGAHELVSRIQPLIVSGQSEVVPQIAIQELDRRLVRAIDDCLTFLVFDQYGEGRQNPVLLEFALRSLRFMSPTPKTQLALYRQAVRVVGTTLDSAVLTLLLDLPEENWPLLRGVCHEILDDEILGDESAPDPLRGVQRLGAGLVSVLLGRWGRALPEGPRTPPLYLLRRGDAGRLPLEAELRVLGETAPDVVHRMLNRDLLTARDFVELLGGRELLESSFVDWNSHGRKEYVAGPLVTALQRLFEFGFIDPELEYMLGVIAGDVRHVLTMTQPVTKALIRVAGDFRGIAERFPLREPEDGETPADAAGFYRLFLFTLCWGFSLQRDLAAPAYVKPIVEGLPPLRGWVQAMRRDSSRGQGWLPRPEDLHRIVPELLRRTGSCPEWQEAFALWLGGWQKDRRR